MATSVCRTNGITGAFPNCAAVSTFFLVIYKTIPSSPFCPPSPGHLWLGPFLRHPGSSLKVRCLQSRQPQASISWLWAQGPCTACPVRGPTPCSLDSFSLWPHSPAHLLLQSWLPGDEGSALGPRWDGVLEPAVLGQCWGRAACSGPCREGEGGLLACAHRGGCRAGLCRGMAAHQPSSPGGGCPPPQGSTGLGLH